VTRWYLIDVCGLRIMVPAIGPREAREKVREHLGHESTVFAEATYLPKGDGRDEPDDESDL
jgi:hypothetical protein